MCQNMRCLCTYCEGERRRRNKIKKKHEGIGVDRKGERLMRAFAYTESRQTVSLLSYAYIM